MTAVASIPNRRVLGEAATVGVVVFALYCVAANQIAVGWDEGFTFDRLHLLERWFGDLWRSGDVSKMLSRDTLEKYWRFSKEEPDGHGPFYCLLSLASYKLTAGWVEPPACYRFGSIGLFAAMTVCVYGTLRKRWDAWVALATVGLLATIPRVVPEVTFALIDGPLFSLSLLTWCGFCRALAIGDDRPDSRSSIGQIVGALPFGVCIGLAMATKVTGWMLVGPYISWAILRQRGFAIIGAGIVIGLLVCFALNVGWWPDPVDGITRFWRSNLTREKTIPIETLFLGTRYPFSLPWYNTLIWTVVANPVAMIALGMSGVFLAAGRWRHDEFGLLLVLNWLLLMVVRALPKAPGHDGTRQIIVSFGFLVLLAGYALMRLANRDVALWRKRLAKLLAVAAFAESVISVAVFHPMELSYYSPAVGGLPGATRLGFEPTYFWDALTPDMLEWLNRETPPDGWVLFRNNPISFDHLTRWGKLRVEHRPRPGQPATWLVMQNRPGIFVPADEWLIANGKPVKTKVLFGVPLIWIFPGSDFERSRSEAAKTKPTD